jgi:phosphoesterase RecJ-like protein
VAVLTGDAVHAALWDLLTDGLPAVLTSHVRLDGDGIGSTLALSRALALNGVDARTVLDLPVPAMFAFLPGVEAIEGSVEGLPDYYNMVVVDCGSIDRAAAVARRPQGRARIANLDHHDSNTFFGDVNYVDARASSCGEMVHALLEWAGVPLDRQMADCLFTAIVTDTGRFSHRNTTPEALRACGACVGAGARPDLLVRRLFACPSPAQTRLKQMALATLCFHLRGRVATMRISTEMLSAAGLQPADTEGFSDIPIDIQGVEASALLKQAPDVDYIKVSMRSTDTADVGAVARAFGGGGHRHAAGFEFRGTLDEAEEIVLSALKRSLSSPAH